ncbi:MAG TPA: M48 family metallopeptidase [Kofleriaceae bacterium]|jgi:Zn-dependent protease with chaperone function|nr:M48 family metallopeptidase [Kofleriaceae bacterium]
MVDFDFARYVQARRGEVGERAHTGASYAFAGERKLRRSFIGARPVTMAIEATTRLWNDRARDELLGSARTAAAESPRVWDAAKRAAASLKVATPSVYLAPASFPARTAALGTDDQPYLVVRTDVADALDERELTAALGHELGHIQNGHVIYVTAQHYLTHAAFVFVRWMVQPAMMALKAWARRAEITCDRAALLASRDLDATLRAMVKLEVGPNAGVDVDAYLAAPAAAGPLAKVGELFRANPLLSKRLAALRLFAGGALYAQVTGGDPTDKPSTTDIDKQVADLLAVF